MPAQVHSHAGSLGLMSYKEEGSVNKMFLTQGTGVRVSGSSVRPQRFPPSQVLHKELIMATLLLSPPMNDTGSFITGFRHPTEPTLLSCVLRFSLLLFCCFRGLKGS